MRRNEALEWMENGAAAAALGVESVGVIGLRLAGAAVGGPRAAQEAWLMCFEKVAAVAELQGKLMMGTLGATPSGAMSTTLRHYRLKVAANRRRLVRSF